KWKNIFGESFVIKTSLNENKWKLTKESKLIGNYYCLKATISYVVSNSQGDFTKQVVAWYCPEIPYNFGPKNYSGLPGLILELTDDKIIYTVKNIDFKSGEVEINQLPKGKYITQEELNKMAKKLIEERNQMLQQD
ncbi:MAG: GLPGLI family protein, partial [Mangrovimonas sp.]|nr:GLPGLI family protein [Mangrovimonas sp.]